MWRNLFLPHPKSHKKAYLISREAILSYILLFVLLYFSLNIANQFKPGVLGINSDISQQTLIILTNQERDKKGLQSLKENKLLNLAAYEKAKNMFEENYWAHYSPSGQDPWGFISRAGYKFSYAGENLARNFYNSEDVVKAWMASPSHRDNIVNSRYQEIGIAVVEGVLANQKTTLVVQMFGTSRVQTMVQKPLIDIQPTKNQVEQLLPAKNTGNGKTLSSSAYQGVLNAKPLDAYYILKFAGTSIILIIALLLILDYFILKRRGVININSRHIAHLTMIAVALGALFNIHPGDIL